MNGLKRCTFGEAHPSEASTTIDGMREQRTHDHGKCAQRRSDNKVDDDMDNQNPEVRVVGHSPCQLLCEAHKNHLA